MISHSVLKLLNYTKFILHKISSAYAVRCSVTKTPYMHTKTSNFIGDSSLRYCSS